MSKRSNKMFKKPNNAQLNKMERINMLLKQQNKPIENAKHIEPIETLIETIVEQKVDQYIACNDKKISLSSIYLTDHAHKQAIKRFNLQRTGKNDVLYFIRKKLLKAEYVGNTNCSNGNEAEMFVYENMAIYLSPDLKLIVTVIRHKKIPHSPIQDKIKALVDKEFRKLDRAEKAKCKKLELHKHEVALEIAELQLRIYKTRSISVKLACKARVNALNIHLVDLQNEIEQLQNHKRQVSKMYAIV